MYDNSKILWKIKFIGVFYKLNTQSSLLGDGQSNFFCEIRFFLTFYGKEP